MRLAQTDFCCQQTAANPHAKQGDVETATNHLHALFGETVLKPREGILCDYPTPKCKRAYRGKPYAYKGGSGGRMNAALRAGLGVHCSDSRDEGIRLK